MEKTREGSQPGLRIQAYWTVAMRVTKVKDVRIERTASGGCLRVGTTSFNSAEAIQEFLRTYKRPSFLDSVVNKTLARDIKIRRLSPSYEADRQFNYQLKTLKKIFLLALGETPQPDGRDTQNLTALKRLPKEALQKRLHGRWHGTLEYSPTAQAPKIACNLVDELHTALQGGQGLHAVAEKLKGYSAWARWYMPRRQQLLARSITGNKLDYTGEHNPSPRKQALMELAPLFADGKGQHVFQQLADAFHLSELCAAWLHCWHSCPKHTREEVAEAASKRQATPRQSDIGLPKDAYEFRRSLKKALQSHQTLHIVKAEQGHNRTLNLFSQETSKYLALYFPLKKSGKRLNVADISYYLTQQTIVNRLYARLANALAQHNIMQGKALFYGLGACGANPQDSPLNSELLQHHKITEAFCLHCVNACFFAAANLRTCLGAQGEDDILGSAAFKKCLAQAKAEATSTQAAARQLGLFFTAWPLCSGDSAAEHKLEAGPLLEANPALLEDFAWAVRGSIQGIRNVLMHYKPEERTGNVFAKLLALEHYESAHGNKPYAGQALLPKLLQHRLEGLPLLFAHTLRSAGLFEYYPCRRIQEAFPRFSLATRPLAFIPAFRAVFAMGAQYQHDGTYPLPLSWYCKKTDMEDGAYEAMRNALRLAYSQGFMDEFLCRQADFAQAVQAVLQANQDYAWQGHNGQRPRQHAWAFKEVPSFVGWLRHKEQAGNAGAPGAPGGAGANPLVLAYLQQVQSLLVQEEAKKRKEFVQGQSTGLAPEATGHFQKFLWQVFAKGFDSYLTKHKALFDFIRTPHKQWAHVQGTRAQTEALNACVRQFAPRVQHNIQPQNNSHVAFWSLCTMLDARRLNELGNQFSKLAQAQAKALVRGDSQQSYAAQREIIQLCLLTADQNPAHYSAMYANAQACLDALAPYVAAPALNAARQDALYVQEDGTTPVLFASVELAKRYASAAILQAVLAPHPVSLGDIERWRQLAPQAPALAAQRQNLHDAWAKSEKRNKGAWCRDNGREYKDVCDKLDAYTWLDNKVHLVHVRDLHHLLIELLGRFAGFAFLWERDLRFYNAQCDSATGTVVPIPESLDLRSMDAARKTMLYRHFLSAANTDQPGAVPDGTGKNWKDKRNYIAHMNYLTRGAKSCSLLDLLYYTHSLVRYDRKLDNAVPKAFITLLSRHGISLRFKPLHTEQHRFVIDSIQAENLCHLGGGTAPRVPGGKPEALTSPRHSPEYVAMVRSLLEHKA